MALLIVQPLVGWAATSAYRAPIIVYGLFELPPILPVNQPLSERLFAVHRGLGFLMAVLVLRPCRGGAVSSFRPARPRADAHDQRRAERPATRPARGSSFRQFVNAALTMNAAADVGAATFTVCIA